MDVNFSFSPLNVCTDYTETVCARWANNKHPKDEIISLFAVTQMQKHAPCVSCHIGTGVTLVFTNFIVLTQANGAASDLLIELYLYLEEWKILF